MHDCTLDYDPHLQLPLDIVERGLDTELSLRKVVLCLEVQTFFHAAYFMLSLP